VPLFEYQKSIGTDDKLIILLRQHDNVVMYLCISRRGTQTARFNVAIPKVNLLVYIRCTHHGVQISNKKQNYIQIGFF